MSILSASNQGATASAQEKENDFKKAVDSLSFYRTDQPKSNILYHKMPSFGMTLHLFSIRPSFEKSEMRNAAERVL